MIGLKGSDGVAGKENTEVILNLPSDFFSLFLSPKRCLCGWREQCSSSTQPGLALPESSGEVKLKRSSSALVLPTQPQNITQCFLQLALFWKALLAEWHQAYPSFCRAGKAVIPWPALFIAVAPSKDHTTILPVKLRGYRSFLYFNYKEDIDSLFNPGFAMICILDPWFLLSYLNLFRFSAKPCISVNSS